MDYFGGSEGEPHYYTSDYGNTRSLLEMQVRVLSEVTMES